MDEKRCLSYYFFCPRLLPLLSRSPSLIPPSLTAAPVETQKNAELGDFFLILPLPFHFQNPSSDHLLLLLLLPHSVIPLFLACPPFCGFSALGSTPSTHSSCLTFEGGKRREGMDEEGRKRRFADLWGVIQGWLKQDGWWMIEWCDYKVN